jgi:hypothetical protein
LKPERWESPLVQEKHREENVCNRGKQQQRQQNNNNDNNKGKLIETGDIAIKRGLFEADPLSPLLFCFSLINLTEQLNKPNTGHEKHTKMTKVSHLIYIDDLKLIDKTVKEFQKKKKKKKFANVYKLQ